MQETPAQPQALDLRDYLTVLRRRKWSIALITCLTIGSALAFSFRQTPIYRSEARVLVHPISTSLQTDIPVNLETERALVSSASVAAIVGETLGITGSPDGLIESLDVSVETSTEILIIGYSDPDPARAQRLASAFTQAYLEFRSSSARQQLDTQIAAVELEITDIEQSLARLEIQIQSTTDPAELTQLTAARNTRIGRELTLKHQRDGLRIASANLAKSGEVVQPARLPTSPDSPKHVRTGALALVVGLALGIGLAFLRERLDEGIRDRADLEEALGAPVLAMVPKVPGWRKRDKTELASLTAPKEGTAEGYLTLRTNLQFIARTGDFKILSVTSPTAGEGKTTTVANLAVVLAHSGKRVIAVSCDLRKPRLHRFFDLPNEIGVTSILTGKATLKDAAQRCEVPTLRVLASGPIPPNPADLLGSDEMQALLNQLRQAADFVVVDTAPLLVVSDTLILAPLSDGVLVVADATTSTRGAIAHLREQLDQVESKVVGGVLNNFDPSRAKYHPSYYRYAYSNRYVSENDQAARSPNGQRAPSEAPEDIWR